MTSQQSSKRRKHKRGGAAQKPVTQEPRQAAGRPASEQASAGTQSQHAEACESEVHPAGGQAAEGQPAGGNAVDDRAAEGRDAACDAARLDGADVHPGAGCAVCPFGDAGSQPEQADDPSDLSDFDSDPKTTHLRALLAVSSGHESHRSGHGHHNGGRRHRHRHHRHHRHRSLGRRIARGILIALLALLLAVVLVAGAVAVYAYNSVKAGEEKVLSAGRPKIAATLRADTSDESDDSAVQAVEHLYTPTINNTITYKGKTYAPNEKMVSVAFIGSDGAQTGGTVGQADAVVLFTFNLETGAVKVISIPRDSMVDVSEYAGDAYVGQDTMQLCLAYSYGDGAWTSSQRVADLVSRVLYDVPVSYYFTLNLQGIAALNDAIGGVTLTPLQTLTKSENIVEGQQTTLWGDDARLYVQWRDQSDNTSSLDRQQRQMQYLSAFFEQAIAAVKADPAVIANIYNTATQYAWTTLGFDEFSYLASQVLSLGISSVDVESLPGTMGMGERYAEFYLDKEGVRQVVLTTFYHEVDATESNDKLSEERGQADNASIAAEGEQAAEEGRAVEGEQVTGAVQATEGTQAADGDAAVQDAAPQARDAEDQASLEAANGAVGEAAANW